VGSGEGVIGLVGTDETWSRGMCCLYNTPYDSVAPWDCPTCTLRNAVRCAPEPAASVDIVEEALAEELAAMHVASRLFDSRIRWVWLDALERDVIDRALELHVKREISAMESAL
jgi:hypothetical protein